jgi:heavy metal translocating P-type ATPase
MPASNVLSSDLNHGESSVWERYGYLSIAAITIVGIALHILLRFALGASALIANLPLWTVLVVGGVPIVIELLGKLLHWQFGADLIAAVSIVTSVIVGEYLAGCIVVLMASGGEALEQYALRSASSVLRALSRRMPVLTHRKQAGELLDVPVDQVAPGDQIVVFPHEICPVDGTVVEGHGTMDESFLTGEPYNLSKAPGASVISGALNGEFALTIEAARRSVDSRYAQIMRVMQATEADRPQMRRLGDQLGAWYTPLALVMGLAAWAASGDSHRFLAVIIAATPCPLLIAIPVAILGAISLAARRGIIIKRPAVLESVATCRTMIFDKTGTLTYGQPRLAEEVVAPGFDPREVLSLVATLERYSKHPLGSAVLQHAEAAGVKVQEAAEISERPGQGLIGAVGGRQVQITSRNKLIAKDAAWADRLPQQVSGLECQVLIDGQYAATYRFRDEPRHDGRSFIDHLGPRHQFDRILIVSGDRESEVRYLAEMVGVRDVRAEQSPEDKVRIVREETKRSPTLFVGDGINDAPALAAASTGLAFGAANDITAEAADAVILETSLGKIDEFLHISRRLRAIALQSAVGGIAASLIAMVFAAFGYLPPVGGAIAQEMIDVVAVFNAVRVAIPPRHLTDFGDRPTTLVGRAGALTYNAATIA